MIKLSRSTKPIAALVTLVVVQLAVSFAYDSNKSASNQSLESLNLSPPSTYSFAIIEVLKILISIICLIACGITSSNSTVDADDDDSTNHLISSNPVLGDVPLKSPAYLRVSASASETESDREAGKRSAVTPRNNSSIRYRQPNQSQSQSISSAFSHELRPVSLGCLIGLAVMYTIVGRMLAPSADQALIESTSQLSLIPVTYAWTQSLAAFVLAALYSIVLKRSTITPTRWTAVVFQLFGCVVMFVPLWLITMSNQLSGKPNDELPALFSFQLIFNVLLLSACLSCHEMVTHKSNSSIHVQNVLISLFGLIIQFLIGLVQTSQSAVSMSFMLMMLQALLFVASSAVLKYSDAIVKCFGTVSAVGLALYLLSMQSSIDGSQNSIFLTLSFIAMSLLALACFLYMQNSPSVDSSNASNVGNNLRIIVDHDSTKLSPTPSLRSNIALGVIGAFLALGFFFTFGSTNTGLSSPINHTSGFVLTSLVDVPVEQPHDHETAAHTSLYPNPHSESYKERTATMFSNFTVEGYLPTSRWPPGIDLSQSWSARYNVPELNDNVSQDPFRLGSPDRFKGMRNVIISMFTNGAEPTLLEHFKNTDTNFLGPMKAHSDYVIFYTMFPVDAGAQLHNALTTKLECHEITDSNLGTSKDPKISDIYARLRHPSLNFTTELRSIREFITPAGAHLITVPVAVNLPRHLASDPGKMFRPDYMTCWGTRWPLDYMLYSGAVFSSLLLRHPILRGYDYYIKIDLDIQWIKPYDRESIFHDMRAQECVWMHTKYMTRFEDCNILANDTVSHWSETRLGVPPASAEFEWWQSTDYFYGNFVGGWLGWIRSPENSALGEWLYEDDKWAGYFRHRWGDQPPLAKMLGQWFKLNNTQAVGNIRSNDMFHPNKSTVCDYTVLRDNYFFHKKMFFEA